MPPDNSYADLEASIREIETDRFRLKPIGRWRLARLKHAYFQMEDVRRTYLAPAHPPSFWSVLKKTKRSKKRQRYYHEIIAKDGDQTIGLHTTQLSKTSFATMEIIVGDLNWRGKDVVPEVRRAIMVPMVLGGHITQVSNQVYARNFGSILNYQKLGFDHVGTLYQAAFDEYRGELADYLIFTSRGEKLQKLARQWADEAAR
ncbi:MAG: hypothetical protein AAGG69_03515 [Pseudomonadota bacterium]